MKKGKRLLLVGLILMSFILSGCSLSSFKEEVPEEIKNVVERSLPMYIQQMVQMPEEEHQKLLDSQHPSAVKLVESFRENALHLGKMMDVSDIQTVASGSLVHGKMKVSYENGIGYVRFSLTKSGEIQSLTFEKNDPSLPMGLNTEGKVLLFGLVILLILLAFLFFLKKKLNEFSDKLDFLRREQLNVTPVPSVPRIHSIQSVDGGPVDMEDGELVSVIMASIMAYEASSQSQSYVQQVPTNVEGFVARKIRRRNTK